MLKKRKKTLCLIMSYLMMSSALSFYTFADEQSIKDKINENNALIEEIEREKSNILSNIEIETQNLDEINSLLAEKQSQVNEIQYRIGLVQGEIDEIQLEISEKENNIYNKQILIEQTTQEIEYLQEQEKKYRDMFEKRLVMYYKTDIVGNYIYMLINSESIFDFLSNVESVIRIMNTDKTMIKKVNDTADKIGTNKKELEETMNLLVEEKASIEAIERELLDKQSIIIEEKLAEQEGLNYLASLEQAKSELIYSLEEKNAELAEKIESLTSFNYELQAELDALMNDTNIGNEESIGSDSEEFLRPTPGYVTCEFGPRYDPITGEPGYHTGVDFGDWYGVPIKATKSGYVQYSGWISGYGNSVIINHGHGVQSLYAHAESLNVSVGEYVERGQVIAYVGSTGWSTGPHLHFEIRFDGVPVDPMGYV